MIQFENSPKQSIASSGIRMVVLLMLLAAGLAIRIYDLTDLPLDFHPTRQLLSAIKARGMYYEDLEGISESQREFAVREWRMRAQVEPEVFERLVAFTYEITGEHVWIARLYASAFWTVGAIFLFLLTRELISADAALLAVAIHLFLPYGLTASRSFQPDPMMAALVIIFWWAMNRWSNSLWPRAVKSGDVQAPGSKPPVPKAWAAAMAAGLAGGLAIFVKFTAVFLILGGAAGALIGREPLLRTLRRPQVWLMAFLGVLPGALYLIYGVFVAGYLGQQFEGRFIPQLFLDKTYYLGWLGVMNQVVGPATIALALLGLALLREPASRRFVVGLWLGYAALGLYFNYHISTHDYYSLPLIPIAALSISPLASPVLSRLVPAWESRWARLFIIVAVIYGLAATLWDLRQRLGAVDYRREGARWAEIGSRLGPDARVVALTEDYGLRLTYWGWVAPRAWPTSGDLRYHALRGGTSDFENRYAELTSNREYFLVTDFLELQRQPELGEKLSGLPTVWEGEEYVIFRLPDSEG